MRWDDWLEIGVGWYIDWFIDWLMDWLIAGRDENQETREGAGSQADDWLRGCSRTGSTKEKTQTLNWGEQRTLSQGLALHSFITIFLYET